MRFTVNWDYHISSAIMPPNHESVRAKQRGNCTVDVASDFPSGAFGPDPVPAIGLGAVERQVGGRQEVGDALFR